MERIRKNRLGKAAITRKPPVNLKMSVKPTELERVRAFNSFLKGELGLMGVKGKFNVAVTDNPKKLGLSPAENETASTRDKGGTVWVAHKNRRGGVRYFIGVWRPRGGGGFTTEDILCHEAGHCAASELMREAGWNVVRRSWPERVMPFKEGLAISFDLERFAGDRKKMEQHLKRYSSRYEQHSEYEEHRLGLRLANAIMTIAPESPEDRRLLREKTAESAFRYHVGIYDILRYLKNTQAVRGELEKFKRERRSEGEENM